MSLDRTVLFLDVEASAEIQITAVSTASIAGRCNRLLGGAGVALGVDDE
jgi:hypothetical protein